MSESTRRGFLIMAGAGAAATAGAVVVANTGSAGAAPADTATTDDTVPATASGPLVAYVRDTRSGQVSVLVGETEVVVSDPALVARLASIAAGKKA